MTTEEWTKEVMAVEVIGAIHRFREERPHTLHQLARETASGIVSHLRSGGIMLGKDISMTKQEEIKVCKDFCYKREVVGLVPSCRKGRFVELSCNSTLEPKLDCYEADRSLIEGDCGV